jgi:uncharacterized protein (TIGR04255 family)
MELEEGFPNPPITEAVIDIRCEVAPHTDPARLIEMHGRVIDRFPNRQDRNVFQGQFQIDAGGLTQIAPPTTAAAGYQFISSDHLKIVQAKPDGFTLNKLRPYTTWDAFIAEAQSLWADYRDVAQPTKITRVAIRYINRIDIPYPVGDLKQWLLTGPEIAPGCPQDMAAFFVRIAILDTVNGNNAVVIETPIDVGMNNTHLSVIFDIEVFKDVAFGPSDADVWEAFASLRGTRNAVFFNSITDKTRELFR